MCPNFGTIEDRTLPVTIHNTINIATVCVQPFNNNFFLSSFRSHAQNVAHDCSYRSLLITDDFRAQFPIFFPSSYSFPSNVLSPASFIIYQLLISSLCTSLPHLPSNLSTLLPKYSFFVYYYELFLPICIT